MKIEVGMYIRTYYDFYRGKIGKIIKSYKGELEIAYKDCRVNTSIAKFIDDNTNYFDGLRYKTSYDIKDLIMAGDLIEDSMNGINEVIENEEKDLVIPLTEHMSPYISIKYLDIISVVTKEQFEREKYVIGE